jgi:hypothetical protein
MAIHPKPKPGEFLVHEANRRSGDCIRKLIRRGPFPFRAAAKINLIRNQHGIVEFRDANRVAIDDELLLRNVHRTREIDF